MHQPQYESMLARTAKQGSRRVEVDSLGDKLTIVDLDSVPDSSGAVVILAEGVSVSTTRASFSFLNGCKCVGALSADGKELRWESGALPWHRDKDRGSLIGRWYAEEPRGRQRCWFDLDLELTAAAASRPPLLRQLSRASRFSQSFSRSFASLADRSSARSSIPKPMDSSSEDGDELLEEESASHWETLRARLREIFVHPSTSVHEMATALPDISIDEARLHRSYRVMRTVHSQACCGRLPTYLLRSKLKATWHCWRLANVFGFGDQRPTTRIGV